MQTASIALVCVLSAGAVAVAAEQTPQATPPAIETPQPPAGHPPYPPVPPPNGQGGLGLPDLESHDEHPEPPPSKPQPPPNATPRPPDLGAARSRPDAGRRNEPPHGRTCFSQGETREKIVAHRLSDPFRAFRSGHIQGDALRARLCRWRQDQFVYEISVLRRDGRIAHVYMDATTGQTVTPSADVDRK